MGDNNSLFSCILDYIEACERQSISENEELEKQHLIWRQQMCSFQERQRSDLVELRKCIEYINQHAHMIQSSLRNVGSGEYSMPLCSSLVRDVIDMRSNIQECINNALEIKKIVGVNYEPFMNNLLRKMETELNNWSIFLNVTSRALHNSRALMDNIENLTIAQQQICAEVTNSDLFLSMTDENASQEQQQPGQRACSTPIAGKSN